MDGPEASPSCRRRATSPSAIVSRLVELEYDGLPKDFLQQLREKVVKLTKEDILAVSRKHLHPDRLKIIAVGSGVVERHTSSQAS